MTMRVYSLACVAVACVVGCNAGSDRDGDASVDLEGRQFLSTTVDGHMLVPGTEIRLSFHDGELSVSAGCNHLSGTFRVEDGVLRIDAFGSTEIGCDADLAAQDQWLFDLLTREPLIVVQGDLLMLTGEDGSQLTFLDREVASPDRPLVGTRWIGNGTGDDMAISFGPGSEQVSVSFGEDGTVEIFNGCASGGGRFTADATTITFEDLAYGKNACADPSLSSLASMVSSVLDGSPVDYTIEEANLTLSREHGLLLFRAED